MAFNLISLLEWSTKIFWGAKFCNKIVDGQQSEKKLKNAKF